MDLHSTYFTKKLFCTFIDYHKAFETVNRTALWQKLLSYNINSKILKVIKNLYDNAKSSIKNSMFIVFSATLKHVEKVGNSDHESFAGDGLSRPGKNARL